MGLGDVKMMFMVGAYLGWPLTRSDHLHRRAHRLGRRASPLMARRGERDMQMLLPFGIFLGIGALVSLLFGTQLVDWYVARFLGRCRVLGFRC